MVRKQYIHLSPPPIGIPPLPINLSHLRLRLIQDNSVPMTKVNYYA
ncbi:hypothetical protein VPHD518_0098 [Vibrio phage D518]